MRPVFEIKASTDVLERAAERLQSIRGGVEIAASRAINRAVTAGRAELVRGVGEKYTVKTREVRRTLAIKKATKADLDGEIRSEGPGLSLRHFKHSPAKGETTGAKRRQVRVSVKKGGGGALATGFLWDGGWGSGKNSIYVRLGQKIRPTKGYHKGKSYLVNKIQKTTGPSVPQMAGSDGVRERVQTCLETTFEKRLDHEVDYLLSKGKSK